MKPIIFTPKMMVDLNIDDHCRFFVEFFNKRGLITQYSCQGHDTDCPSESIDLEIIFDKISDSVMKDFIYDLEKFCWDRDLSILWSFEKWTIYMPEGYENAGQVMETWTFSISGQTHDIVYKQAKATEAIFKAFEAYMKAKTKCDIIDRIDDDFVEAFGKEESK